MIPVTGFEGQEIAILGLGRSGLSAARALRAGGAEPVCWDDHPAEGSHRGEGRLLDGVQLTDDQLALDLESDDEEEDCHEAVVDEVLQRFVEVEAFFKGAAFKDCGPRVATRLATRFYQ